MSGALRILSAGPGVTLQDGGRRCYLRFGVTGAGPMDPLAHATANLAVGVAPDAAAIEAWLGGLDLANEGAALTIAIAGGDFKVAVDGKTMPPRVRATLQPGATLSIRPGAAGCWCYVAVAGRIDVRATLGSVSTHTRSGIGGLNGKALATGDVLPVASPRVVATAAADSVAPWLDRASGPIRVVLGPQDDFFASDQIAAFLDGPWTISPRSDRMACLLDGPSLTHAKGFNIVSDGVALGAIQVPGDCKPIVLMADRQPTGGYPKIATVIGADIGRLAQLRPGTTIRFTSVTIAEAVVARRAEHELLARPIEGRPLTRTDLPSELLLTLNLVDGVIDAKNTEAPRHLQSEQGRSQH